MVSNLIPLFKMEATRVLRRARSRSGLTIRQLAQRAGTSHSAVAAYESGAKAPNVSTFLRLIRACGFDLQPRLRALGPLVDRVRRGEELVEVLKLADQLPHKRNGELGPPFPPGQ
jgi:transcriptional regulator with XRE-family HTH domain